jgi:hypothetical protein
MHPDSLELATMIRGARESLSWRRLGRYRVIRKPPSIAGQPAPLILAWVWM